MYTKCILNCIGLIRGVFRHFRSIEKAPPKWGSFLVLLEQASDAEHGLPVDLVVGGFPGVSYPPHALLSISGYEGLLRLLLPLARGSRLEGASGVVGMHAALYWNRCSHSRLSEGVRYQAVASTSSINFPCTLAPRPISAGRLYSRGCAEFGRAVKQFLVP